jgi:tetratricopeptide (TPR) repeat protein
MGAAKKKIARHAEASADFLVWRPGVRPHLPEEAPAADDDRLPQALAGEFAELLRGEEFMAAYRRRVGGLERFSVLAARSDPPAADDPETLAASWRAAARGLDRIARAADGFWGIPAPGILAAVFPGQEAPQVLEGGRRWQKKLRAGGHLTATAGVAGFPCDGFAREEIVANAVKALAHAAFFGPNSRVVFDAVSLNISADACFDRGDLAGAIREFERALALDPDCANVHNSLGVCHGVRGDYDRALAEFTAASRLDAGDHMSVYNIGLVHWLTGDREAALACFERANAIKPNLGDILFQLGRLLLELGRPGEARAFLESAARSRSRRRGVHRYLGDCYAALGLAAKAIAAYQKAVRFNAADAHALCALGGLFEARGENLDIALVFCRESVQLAPHEARFRSRLARVLLRLGRLEEALAELEHAERLGAEAAAEIRGVRERLAGREPT